MHFVKSALNVRFDGFCVLTTDLLGLCTLGATTLRLMCVLRITHKLPTQCEAKKRDEYRATSELSGAHFAAPTSYMEARTHARGEKSNCQFGRRAERRVLSVYRFM